MAFVHLGVRSEYAIVDSIVRIDELVQSAKENGQTALGLADLYNTFALVKFYKACVGAGIKPLLGSEVVVADSLDADGEFSVILYAMNNDGYKNLLRLVSDSYTMRPMGDNGKVINETPIITKSALAERNDGLIAILTHRSEIAQTLYSQHPQWVLQKFEYWQQTFGDRLYLGIKRTHTGDDEYNENAIIYGSQAGIPIIAHNDVRFMNKTPELIGKEEHQQ